MRYGRVIGNTLAAAALLAASACTAGAPAETPGADFPAADLEYLPNNHLWDSDRQCWLDMRYSIDAQSGKVTDFVDPELYSDEVDYSKDGRRCARDTVFPPNSFSGVILEANREAYQTFQYKATQQLEKGTQPINSTTELYTFADHQLTWVPAIGRVGLKEDGALQAQLFNGANETPHVATNCYISPEHQETGTFSDNNRMLGHVMYHGERDTPYALIQLGSNHEQLPNLEMPPTVNGSCEPGTVVAVRAETSVNS